ncbi:MAG: low molecular weight protein-tyrosine-phosphatase [Gammaproteobacteria bacterium]
MVRNILMVCIGNICRSPMAQGLIGQRLCEAGIEGFEVKSAGLNALVGYPVEGTAQRLMQEQGVDLSAHRARQLDRELLLWADLILVMEKEQKKILNSIAPTARGKTYRLGEWSDADVLDPYGQPIEVFRDALRLIDDGVCEWLERFR